MTVFGAIIDDGCNGCCHCELWRQHAETKMKVVVLHPTWLHRKSTPFNGVGTSTTSGKLDIPMAIRLQESDMVIRGCVHSHDIPEKTHHMSPRNSASMSQGRVSNAILS